MARYQLVILVGQAEWRVVHFSGWRYQALYVFTADADMQRLLLDHLQRYAAARLYFLTDIAEEHYHIELCPPVRGTARKLLLARRLAAWPYAQGLHAVLRVSSRPGLPQADRYLFAAIHYPPLSQLLQSQPLRVHGVHTQALCSPCWASTLPSAHTHCLIGYVEKQQLRLRYLYRSQLVFSRLLALMPDASLNLPISNEIVQTRLYLLSQQWLQEGEPLHLLWLSEDGHDQDLSPQQLPAVIQSITMSYAALLRQSGWQSVPPGLSVMDWLAMQVLLHNRQLPNLAAQAALLSVHVLRAKRMLVAACSCMILLLLAANYLSRLAMQKTQSDIRHTSAQIQLWQSAQPAWGIADADLPRLQTFSQAVQDLQAAARYPDRLLMIVQQVMAGQQVWQVNTIDWVYAATPAATTAAGQEPQSAETATIQFSRQAGVSAEDAQQEWQLLQQKLRLHPHILALKEMRGANASASQSQQGDTRLSEAPEHQTALSFSLRPLKNHIKESHTK